VENEYQSKAGDVSVYRDTDFIPLPFQVNQVEVSDAEHGSWLSDKDSDPEDEGSHTPLSRGGTMIGKAKNTSATGGSLSPMSSSYDDDDGDLHMLYSINSTAAL
jgi:hypothetical protein